MRSRFQDFRLIAVLGGVFFGSGFTALLYQVVWQRMLGLFSGSDVRSVTIVTEAYWGGLLCALWTRRLVCCSPV